MLSVKKIYAGRGAADYYLAQERRGLADYYLPDGPGEAADVEHVRTAPGSSWWGGGATSLGLPVGQEGGIRREVFAPLYGRGIGPAVAGRAGLRPVAAAAVRRGVGLHVLAGQVRVAAAGMRRPHHRTPRLERPPHRRRRRPRLPDLRHTWATLALAGGVPAKVVSERLGHANVSITLDVYTHAIPALDQDAADTVAAAIFRHRSPSIPLDELAQGVWTTMKRRDLIRTIERRADAKNITPRYTEGGSHTKVVVGDRRSVIPRHREINERTARAILSQLFDEA